ncbi:hypothetical protein FOVG_17972 [Fusarium oxysporum f. sp. pisi HDV247]|uniref:Glycosyl transferase 64 domain-containing protein n=1 Tax=Fusarium oxysporum f. sp. pisi HDV247 TaxID=1080344 RepID=W9NS98_FUSOX|nr:hypothetical protein FOVG_17972 [Fusarium oxysporum f. sp. pisi HDV247]
MSRDIQTFAELPTGLQDKYIECSGRQKAATADIWNVAERNYRDLRDDYFTVAIQTYRRPRELNNTLQLLLGTKVPSLLEIVIIWNDVQIKPPEDFVSPYNVSVRYRVSQRNSLNEKLWPDPKYRTKAILLSDDDVYYNPSDLDFIFQTWRKNGQNRLTGAFARCVSMNSAGQWQYSLCGNLDSYSMILTGLAFTHIAFLDYFSSEDQLMTKIREYIDARFNCEDIGMNFVASMLTCSGPLQVSGAKKAVNVMPKQGISTKPGHMKVRSQCVNDFIEFFGYLPLRNTTEYIARGLIRG